MVKVPPSASVKRSLSMNQTTPERAQVPDEFKTSAFGQGARWVVYWHGDKGKGKSRRNFQTREAAEEFAASMEDDIRSGRYIDPAGLDRTFDEVASLWESSLSGTIKGSTELRYKRELRVWVLPRWRGVPLGRITTGALQTWVADLNRGVAPREGYGTQSKPLAPKSIRSVVAVVTRAVLQYAVDAGWMPSNPTKGVRIPKAKVAVPRVYLTPAEIKAIADQMDPDNAAAVYLLAFTGIRVGEMMALRCGDVNFDSRTISITKTESFDASGQLTETLPKGNRSRVVPVPEKVLSELGRLVEGHDTGDYLVRAPRGGKQTVRNWRNRVWTPALRAAGLDGIPGLVIHSLRHTFASLAIKSGADVKTLQAVLGHASAAETLDIYADLWPNRKNEVASIINEDVVM